MNAAKSQMLTLLHSGIERGGFETDDVLAIVLPLFRQTVQWHENGFIAPLEKYEEVKVSPENKLCFETETGLVSKRNPEVVEKLQSHKTGAIEILGEMQRTTDLDEGSIKVSKSEIGLDGESISKPVYLAGYHSWEVEIGHHDELTDIFLLGQILASFSCGLDLTDPGDLELFVIHRKNLFALNARLNPVLSSVIVQMTELNRHRRAQDAGSLIRRLESYREQPVDLDLNRLPGFKDSTRSGKRKIIQAHLKERLFDVSRRNRLIYFRSTLQSLNLTVASVPLLLDYRNIRLEQLFVWHSALAAEISAAGAMSLSKYLRFEDAPYIPGVLDKIISEARRDRAEFGFSQLRLVICFLRWHNLKEETQERIHSPLLLLPVELTKKRGIRDNYVLDPTSSEAEVNPALRHFLKQLYNLDLPESIDLRETSLDAFHADLQARIQASEPAVTLQRIDRPQIELIHERAKQRLDQFRRRQKLRMPPARASVDYSYDREHLKPRGLQVFLEMIRPAPAPLRDVAGAPPKPRLPQIVDGDPPPSEGNRKVTEVAREAFALREGENQGVGNPYAWEFDLCALTLGNFNYRKMTLMRDYSNLVENDLPSAAFDSIFSLDPKPPEEGTIPRLPVDDHHLVIPCDATQASAIARARTGQSYIIQGPPGTGKSQTITNLIADFVARGKRVLFVCEKRAAIDVVFYRLRQQGLDELCCLIHDSQTDKKAFIQNLKQTCEQWLANGGAEDQEEKARVAALGRIQKELTALHEFSKAMTGVSEITGLSLRELLQRLIRLRDHLEQLSPEEEESLPHYKAWLNHGETVERLGAILGELGEDPCFAKSPFRWVNLELAQEEDPLQTFLQRLEKAESLLEEMTEAFGKTGLPEARWDSISEVEILLEFAGKVRPLAERNLLALLDPNSALTKRLGEAAAAQVKLKDAVEKAAKKTVHWKEKLPANEAEAALEQAKKFQGSVFAFFNPAWWRLRRVMNAQYDFSKHAVRPEWTKVLGDLIAEWNAGSALEEATMQAREQFGADDLTLFAGEIAALQSDDNREPEAIQSMRAVLFSSPEARAIVNRLAELEPRFVELMTELKRVLAGFEEAGFTTTGELIRDLRESSDDFPELLPVFAEMAEMPPRFVNALRQLELEGSQFEAAIARKSAAEVFRENRPVSRFDGRTLKRRMETLEKYYSESLEHNAKALRARVRHQFLDHVNMASQSATQLDADQKLFKKNYSAGRRELEHEFGKSMRYKSIRELAGGNSGQVVRDLKPIWLMSPLSVSDTLPLDAELFDVVIFDEASQIPVEEAVPALYRARQVIVVGDEMQLPPTTFFSTAREGEDGVVVEEEGEKIEVALDADSFLTQSAKNLPSTLLAWHYRSRYEALISFSNSAFYSGNLFTIPDRQLPSANPGEIRVSDSSQGPLNVDALLARSISFHFLDKGVYENRRNTNEAEYIARMLRELLRRETKLSIGIVAFSEAQQTEIETALERLAEEDEDFSARLEAEYVREENDQFCGLFVKNLENVQGDERDIIIMSICYGYNRSRKMHMNFGPINQRGGEKRLNVIFSRARHYMAVVSSIRHPDITNDYNDGANTLKNFLQYSESVSKGDFAAARRIMENLNPLSRKALLPAVQSNIVVEQVAEALRERGYGVDLHVGQSRFRCDLAIRFKDDGHYQLGILVDSEGHYANDDLLERYLTQPSILKAFGWRVIVLLTKDWFYEPELVIQRVERALKNISEAQEEIEQVEAEESIPPAAQPEPKTEISAKNEKAENKPAPLKIRTAVPAGRRFEFKRGASNKFWEISLEGKSFAVRYGRIGTEGQSQTKTYSDEERAGRESEKLIQEKLKKGYKETS